MWAPVGYTDENRLNGLCMDERSLWKGGHVSKDGFVEYIINVFGMKRRNSMFLFTDTELIYNFFFFFSVTLQYVRIEYIFYYYSYSCKL